MKTGAARRLDLEPENPTPESFLQEIHRIFESGTLQGAREVAAQGLNRYPDHPELLRLHHALRPHEAGPVPGYRIPDRQDTFEWLRENEEKYRGQWIAILGTDLIAASPSFKEVYRAALKANLAAPPLLHFVD
jgi:Family of unknown function (DUF5678)